MSCPAITILDWHVLFLLVSSRSQGGGWEGILVVLQKRFWQFLAGMISMTVMMLGCVCAYDNDLYFAQRRQKCLGFAQGGSRMREKFNEMHRDPLVLRRFGTVHHKIQVIHDQVHRFYGNQCFAQTKPNQLCLGLICL